MSNTLIPNVQKLDDLLKVIEQQLNDKTVTAPVMNVSQRARLQRVSERLSEVK